MNESNRTGGGLMRRVFLVFAILSFTSIAQAALISGSMNLGGTFLATGGSGLGDATTLSLTSVSGSTADGDLAATVGFGTLGIVGDAVSLTAFAPPVNALSIGGWSLELTSLTIESQSDTGLKLIGDGLLSGNGFTPTSSVWSFTTTSGSSYAMSVAAVPVPAAVWLMGSGLLGLVGLARRKA